jgi:glycogen operon protein
MSPTPYVIETGRPHPLGAWPDAEGVNFSIYSQHSTKLELVVFDEHDDVEPCLVAELDPNIHRTFYFWHCYVRGLKPGAHYGYRVHGPTDIDAGHRFDPQKLLLDPYSLGNSNTLWDRASACLPGDNLDRSMRSVVIDLGTYDWEGDKPLNLPIESSIIYELNVGGFTRSETSGAQSRGTFSGLIEKIPHLQRLGVTAVELLPVMEFDEKELLRVSPDGRPLTNFWGYSTLGFFAPSAKYCVTPTEGTHVQEFRDMVKALHKAGIEVILDVVFNHTSEGNHEGPCISFKAIDNKIYYHRVQGNERYYMDYSGCGNTVNCNHPIVEKFILECLEFWVEQMHVDGFRFDEGSILSRLQDGTPSEFAPVLWNIELSEPLMDTKLIAEAWDAAGLYQIGAFPGFRWAEWNGRFRDDMRRFVAGQPGMVGAVATRLAGSADLYEDRGRAPVNSINFITCHDGFTLNDLVSFNGKHNEANGEDNRDGIDENLSWNCGFEGLSDDPGLEAFRTRQCKNFATLLLLAKGVPMILGGDEMRRTQGGNNNAYCQDNEVSWFDWQDAERHAGLVRFFEEMIRFRKSHPALTDGRFFSGESNSRGVPSVSWHGCRINQPGWLDPSCRVLAMTVAGHGDDEDLHAIFNMEDTDLDFELPEVNGRAWHMAIETGASEPNDIVPIENQRIIGGKTLRVTSRSVTVLVSR